MQYREFGKTGNMVSAVGMGANRFPAEEVRSAAGLERCADIVVRAAHLGVNFFDSAATYSSGKCEEILRLALPQIKSRCYICGKSSSVQERTRDAVLRYIEKSLKNIGIDFFDFYYMWSVKSFEQYQFILSKGGAYEGVLAAKEQGLVKHICFSSHASAQDTVKIIEDGAFEGVLVSYSLLNFRENDIVLETAKNNGLGVAVMNPLGGGIIPQNTEMFSGSFIRGDTSIVDSALKFVYANNAVSTILSGVSKKQELEYNVQSLFSKDQNKELRHSYAIKNLEKITEFCTGCNYCMHCPAGIPISKIMTAYNQTKFQANSFIYNRTSPELIKRGNFFGKLDGVVEFVNSENPCINCGKCENACTQSLPIIKTMTQIYQWVADNCVSSAQRKKRFESLILAHYKKVGFYTAGVYTSFVLKLYKKLIGKINFEIFIFDSNPTSWGNVYLEEFIVRSPAEISQLDLNVLLISNYIHSDDIYNDLITRYPAANIKKLHEDDDLPWMF